MIRYRDGKLSPDLGRVDLNQPDSGLEWEERMERMEEQLEDPSFVSDTGAGYLYSLAGGDSQVARFSVMIGVWGQADPIKYDSIAIALIISLSLFIKLGNQGEEPAV